MTVIDNMEARGQAAPAYARGGARWIDDPALVPALILGVAAACALVLALPGVTVTTKNLPDLFVLLDGSYRVALGQVPNRDFHTVLGPLVHVLPAIGFLLTGHLGSAMPIGIALFMLLLAPAMAHVLGSRLRPTIALPFALFLILILAVPIALGEGVTSLSFGKFYNRTGWVALATLLVMYLRPERVRPRQDLFDGLAAALLVAVMLYTKATYAVVALAFLACLLLDARQRRWAALALAIVTAVALGVELLWRSSGAYVADLLLAARVSGGLRGTWGQIAEHLLRNLADYVLFALIAGLAVRRTRSLGDLLFFAFCAVAGFLIINQNLQTWGIIAIYSGAAVAAERLARSGETSTSEWPLARGAPLLMLALVLPMIVHSTVALGLHAVVATARGGQELELPHYRGIRLAHLWTWGEHDSAERYLSSLQDGARALKQVEPAPRHVFVLDVANPFSSGLSLEPARGDAPWLRWERTLDGTNFIPPEQLLGGVQWLMEPKVDGRSNQPLEQPGSARGVGGLREVYGPAIAADFKLVRETGQWKIHRRPERP